MKTPNEILGVKEHPSWTEVREAYKQLSFKYHPDLHPGEEEKYNILMSEINAAYDYFKKTLSHDGQGKNDYSHRTRETYYDDNLKKNANPNISLKKVYSSNIDAIGYDEANQNLYVKFIRGSLYIYYGVTKDVYTGFFTAVSVGKYFSQYIRNKYKYDRLS